MKKLDKVMVLAGLLACTAFGSLDADAKVAKSGRKAADTTAAQLQCESLINDDQICLYMPDEKPQQIKSFKFTNRTITVSRTGEKLTLDSTERSVVLRGPLMMTEGDFLARGTDLEQSETVPTLLPRSGSETALQTASADSQIKNKLANVQSFLTSNSLNGDSGKVSIASARVRQACQADPKSKACLQ